jgi:hypothetical protein
LSAHSTSCGGSGIAPRRRPEGTGSKALTMLRRASNARASATARPTATAAVCEPSVPTTSEPITAAIRPVPQASLVIAITIPTSTKKTIAA